MQISHPRGVVTTKEIWIRDEQGEGRSAEHANKQSRAVSANRFFKTALRKAPPPGADKDRNPFTPSFWLIRFSQHDILAPRHRSNDRWSQEYIIHSISRISHALLPLFNMSSGVIGVKRVEALAGCIITSLRTSCSRLGWPTLIIRHRQSKLSWLFKSINIVLDSRHHNGREDTTYQFRLRVWLFCRFVPNIAKPNRITMACRTKKKLLRNDALIQWRAIIK